MTPHLESHALVCGPQLWDDAVARLRGFAAAHVDGDLARLTALAPFGASLVQLRGAMARQACAGIAPRLVTLADLAQEALARFGVPGARTELAARAELYAALRGTRWLRSAFGSGSRLDARLLWNLAGELRALVAEVLFNQAAMSIAAGVETLQAAFAAAYAGRAWAAMSEEAALVRAVLDNVRNDTSDPISAQIHALSQLAQQADTALALLPLAQPEPRIALLAHHWVQPVLALEATFTAAAKPWAIVWPELLPQPMATADRAPLHTRARGFAPPRLPQLVTAATLEDEAHVAAAAVETALRGGAQRVALVALDRQVARRTRALAERARILISDEAGWHLSTTAAATALMRWYDLCSERALCVDLLDWLKTPAVLARDPHKAQDIVWLERTLRDAGVVRGWREIAAALRSAAIRSARSADDVHGAAGADEPANASAETAARARVAALIDDLAELARRARRANAWREHLAVLDALEGRVGLLTALARDAAGAQIVALLGHLRAHDLAGAWSLPEWRATLADALEQAEFTDRSIESPVTMVSLAGSWLREFDALVIVGADGEHLPARAAVDGLLPARLRRELQLPDAAAARLAQLRQLAALLAHEAPVTMSWQSQKKGADNAPSPWLARLRAFVAAAGGAEPAQQAEALLQSQARAVESRAPAQPAPSAPARLPARVSAGAYADLVACPYRFFAQRLLGLRPIEELIDETQARRIGACVHRALERFHRAWPSARASAAADAELIAALQTEIDAAFRADVQSLASYLGAAHEWRLWAPDYIAWLRTWLVEGWDFAVAEQTRERTLPLDSGPAAREVKLVGRIDRIDRIRRCGIEAEAVFDYKTTSDINALKQHKRAPFEHPQLLFYAALLDEPPARTAYLALRAEGGKLLVDAADDPPALVPQLTERVRDQLQRVADGAPLPAHGAPATCEYCDVRGLCRRAHRQEQT